MSEWISIINFNSSDFSSDLSLGSDTGGSGSTPTIALTKQYYLVDQNNKTITDQNKDPLSVEGLS